MYTELVTREVNVYMYVAYVCMCVVSNFETREAWPGGAAREIEHLPVLRRA